MKKLWKNNANFYYGIVIFIVNTVSSGQFLWESELRGIKLYISWGFFLVCLVFLFIGIICQIIKTIQARDMNRLLLEMGCTEEVQVNKFEMKEDELVSIQIGGMVLPVSSSDQFTVRTADVFWKTRMWTLLDKSEEQSYCAVLDCLLTKTGGEMRAFKWQPSTKKKKVKRSLDLLNPQPSY